MPQVKEIIELLKQYDKDDYIAVMIFQTSDVISLAEDEGETVTKDKAIEIIEELHHRQSAETGMNWDTISQLIP